jgi:choline transporter-like protein 2/4/5
LGKVNCDNCCGYNIHYTPHIGIAILFHLFGCYWATQFFMACSSTVVAGSVASYYWARGEISVSARESQVLTITKHANFNFTPLYLYSPLILTIEPILMQHDIPFFSVVSSLKRLLRYNLGSAAIGSLVVSAVEWVRFILECLRRKLKLVDSAREGCCGTVTSSSSQCCLGCIDWTLMSVNRNAYIMVSMKISYS